MYSAPVLLLYRSRMDRKPLACEDNMRKKKYFFLSKEERRGDGVVHGSFQKYLSVMLIK